MEKRKKDMMCNQSSNNLNKTINQGISISYNKSKLMRPYNWQIRIHIQKLKDNRSRITYKVSKFQFAVCHLEHQK